MGLVLEWPEQTDGTPVEPSPPDRRAAPPRPRSSTPRPRLSTGRPFSARLRFACSARLISSLGDGLIIVAFPLLATRLTKSPILIAGVAFSTTVPYLLFGLPAGAVADRFRRRTLILTAEVVRTLVALLLGIAIATGHLRLIELYLAAFLFGSFETVFDAAEMAVIPQLAGRDDLVRVNSRFQTARLTGEQFIGPAIGGALLAVAVSAPVLIDAGSFAASAALLALALRPARRIGRHIRAQRRDRFALAEPTATGRRTSFVADIREGLSWLAHQPTLRLVTGLVATLALCELLGLSVLVIYGTRVLHLSRRSYGVFFAVAESGNVVGAWSAPWLDRRLGPGRTLYSAGVAGAVALLAVGTTSAVPVALVALWLESVAVGAGNVAMFALRQRRIPLELAGRVSAAMRSSFIGAAAAGSLIGGTLVVLFGIHAPFVIGGAAQLIAAVVLGGALVRRIARDEVIDLTDAIDLRGDAVAERA